MKKIIVLLIVIFVVTGCSFKNMFIRENKKMENIM